MYSFNMCNQVSSFKQSSWCIACKPIWSSTLWSPMPPTRKPKGGKLSGEKSREDAKTKRLFDVDEGSRGTQVGRAGDNETFKSQGRDTQGKGDTLGIGDKKGDKKGPGPQKR